MTLFFYDANGDLGTAVRLGAFSITEAADNGIVAMGSFALDDPSGTASLTTLGVFHIDETACDPIRLFSGYLADVTVRREDSLLTGSARRWDVTVSDLNFVWQRKALRGSTANRPAETDLERIAWVLDEIGVDDSGLVSSTGAVNLDATDYRDRYAADVMGDCATASSKNWFAYYDDAAGVPRPSLFYDFPTATVYSSTLRITNDLADVDNDTTFAPKWAPSLTRDPSRTASGIDLVWQGGSTYTNDDDLGFGRDIIVNDQTITTSAKATSVAAAMLARAVDLDTIDVTVQLPADKVNLIKVGHRIQVKFGHLPGYSDDYTYIRVSRRTVAQAEGTDQLYDVTLELYNPYSLGGGGGTTSGGTSTPPKTSPVLPPYVCVPSTVATLDTFNGRSVGPVDVTADGTDAWGTASGGATWLRDVAATVDGTLGGVDGGVGYLETASTLYDGFVVYVPTTGLPCAGFSDEFTIHVKFRFTIDPTTSWVQGGGFHIVLSDDPVTPTEDFYLRVNWSTDDQPLIIYGGDTPDEILAETGFEWVRSNWYHLKWHVVPGVKHELKAWADDAFEPISYQVADTMLSSPSGLSADYLLFDMWVKGEAGRLEVDLIDFVSYCSPPVSGQPYPLTNLGLGDGSSTAFAVLTPYQPGSLKLYVAGIRKIVTETSPTDGTFTFTTAPGSGDEIAAEWTVP